MQLVSIDGRIRALDGPFDAPGTGAIDLAALTGLPSGACRFLGAHGVEAARDKIGRATDIVPIAGVQLDPPIPKPRMIWAVGLNYRDHAAETGRDVPTAPTLFAKSPGALIGHEQPIVIPPHVAQPDYEGEVAVVIGRTARRERKRRARLRRRRHPRTTSRRATTSSRPASSRGRSRSTRSARSGRCS